MEKFNVGMALGPYWNGRPYLPAVITVTIMIQFCIYLSAELSCLEASFNGITYKKRQNMGQKKQLI
jgi:hypothetical protein